ncbi:endophilin-A [Eurytemora carolleeae]|uniref:endophilin-A n=1 Tax=Eurytemora carolleeae TaxID=1294199 RepID=UPI000C76359F|nr:endophilin-A [Eurytemora carolleeae]|eukprot:XP_023346476.1 endophilin-A-like [Eurytemora affinis]
MAFLPGLKKQINKANQFMSEKISGVEGTKLDDDFHTMERKTDIYVELVDDLQIKTKEYLQPNPTVRAKMAAVKGISKLSGQAKASTYPQPEGTLGDAMATFGNKLLDFDNRLVGVAHHRKKLQGRKLDYDCKKRKQQSGGGVPEKEIKQAEDKFAESLHLAQMGMHNIMENDVEQSLTDTLYTKTNEASSREKREFTPKTLEDLGVETSSDYNIAAPNQERVANLDPWESAEINSRISQPSPSQRFCQPAAPANSWTVFPESSPAPQPARGWHPCFFWGLSCGKALYDFEPENAGELGFKEGDIITLKQKLDDNWFEGTLNGKSGFFPINYVTVLVN